jgi:hypothetical protein
MYEASAADVAAKELLTARGATAAVATEDMNRRRLMGIEQLPVIEQIGI